MKQLRILFCGICGRMGANVERIVEADTSLSIVAGVDLNPDGAPRPFPVFRELSEVTETADVLIDFSHHSALPAILGYASAHRLPVVVATTGHNDGELAEMREASKSIPVFYSRNMSLGINLIIELSKKAAATLGKGFDIEIVEQHHNKKLDAPSGTALMIADAINEAERGRYHYVFDRHSERRERDCDEIGIYSVRGGTIVGEHEVIFAGNSEVIRLRHSAESRTVFAEGAVRAAKYLSGQPSGLYSMTELVQSIL